MTVNLRLPDEDKPGIGHNNPAGEQLARFVSRIENVESEIAALADDKKLIYAEAKAAGFTPKVMRKMISMRKQDHQKLKKEQELLDTYMHAIGWDIFS